MLPYIVLGIGALLALRSQSAPAAAMSPTQRMVFQNALTADPPLNGPQLRVLAAQYDSEGHTAEADILLRRARIAELSDKDKATLTGAFKRGLSQKDPIAVRALANAFESEGLFGNAAALRDWANKLDVGATIEQTASVPQAQQQSQQQEQQQTEQGTIAQAAGQMINEAINTAATAASN